MGDINMADPPISNPISTTREEKKNAHDMIALRKWVMNYNLTHSGKDPSRAELWQFIQALQERAWINPESDIGEIIEEEKEIREIAKDMCKVQGINPNHIHILLTPNPNWTFRVQGGTPSEIYLGIRLKSQSFKIILAEAIKRAGRMYRPSALIPMSKVIEYKHETKKIRKLHEDSEHYKLVDVSRIKIVEHKVFTVIDKKTGELITVSREMSNGDFRHYNNDRLAHEGRLVMSRLLLTKGLINNDDEEDDDNG
jgi:hypothetical protein